MEGSPGKFSLEPSVVLGDSDCQERSPLSSISSLIHFSQKSVMPHFLFLLTLLGMIASHCLFLPKMTKELLTSHQLWALVVDDYNSRFPAPLCGTVIKGQ